jgi:RES domain-containing protein
MAGLGRRHDRALLDALEGTNTEAFDGTVWRVTSRGRDPLRGSTAGGRWSPPGEFEVLYTSLESSGAVAEIGYRLSLEPVWPSRAQHDLHRIAAQTKNTLRFSDVRALEPLGVDPGRYTSFNYAATQSIAAAAHFLEFDGLIVPSARSQDLNLVVFLERVDAVDGLHVDATEAVDWEAWSKRWTR